MRRGRREGEGQGERAKIPERVKEEGEGWLPRAKMHSKQVEGHLTHCNKSYEEISLNARGL